MPDPDRVLAELRSQGYRLAALQGLRLAEDAARQAHAFMHYGTLDECEAGICVERRRALAATPSEPEPPR